MLSTALASAVKIELLSGNLILSVKFGLITARATFSSCFDGWMFELFIDAQP